MLEVSVAYADSEQAIEIPLEVEASCTLIMAIRRSGILNKLKHLTVETLSVGMWGNILPLDACVTPNARIEIYRPLQIDPKLGRKLRAQKK